MKTPISYYGGKQTLLKHILPLIPKHKLYTEAFCGGAAVLFAKRPADGEVINDISMDITNFYWMAKVYYRDLNRRLRRLCTAGICTPMPDTYCSILNSFSRCNVHGLFGRYVKCPLPA